MGLLDGLDRVDWKTVRHAYGEATDVPGYLRDLASGNAEKTKDATYALFGNICHQGTVYQATPLAVPFLVELAEAREVLAGGHPRLDRRNSRGCRRRERRLRIERAPLLGRRVVPRRGGVPAPGLEAHRRPPKGGLVGKLLHEPASAFLKEQAASKNAAVRFAAHLGLVLTLGEKAPEDAVEQVHALRGHEELIGQHLDGLPWDLYGELNAAELLARIGVADD